MVLLSVAVALAIAGVALAIVGGGKPAGPADYDWVAQIRHNSKFTCTGSLVRDRWILTAAHCVFPSDGSNVVAGDSPYPASTFSVVVGERKREPKNFQQAIAVSDVVPDPGYDGTASHDVALLHLTTTAPVHAAALAESSNRSAWDPGQPVMIAGWGAILPTFVHIFLASSLLQATTSVGESSYCSAKVQPGPFDPSLELCTPANHPQPCHGDSGGPLFTAVSGDQPEVIGVVHGVGVAAEVTTIGQRFAANCWPGAPTVFVKVGEGELRNWVEGILNGGPKLPVPLPQTVPAHVSEAARAKLARFTGTLLLPTVVPAAWNISDANSSLTFSAADMYSVVFAPTPPVRTRGGLYTEGDSISGAANQGGVVPSRCVPAAGTQCDVFTARGQPINKEKSTEPGGGIMYSWNQCGGSFSIQDTDGAPLGAIKATIDGLQPKGCSTPQPAGVTGPAKCGSFISRGLTVQILIHSGTIPCPEATGVLKESARGQGVRAGAAGTASPPGWQCYAGGPGLNPVAAGFSCQNNAGVLIVGKSPTLQIVSCGGFGIIAGPQAGAGASGIQARGVSCSDAKALARQMVTGGCSSSCTLTVGGVSYVCQFTAPGGGGPNNWCNAGDRRVTFASD